MKAWGVAPPETSDLLARARNGEGDAFSVLVEQHHPELVRIAYAIIGDLDAARDAAQLAWIKAWQRLPSLREADRLRPWLIAIAANEARQSVRAQRRRRIREITPVDPDGIPPIHALSAVTSTDSLDLAAALTHLSTSDRQLLAMRYLAGLSADEISRSTALSASGVRTRLSRLVARLRKELDHE